MTVAPRPLQPRLESLDETRSSPPARARSALTKICLGVLPVILLAHAVSARTLNGAFGQEKAPYLWVEKGEVKGLEYDIIKAALAKVGDDVKPSILPNKRVSGALGSPDIDFTTGVQIDQAGPAFYSERYLGYANYAITKKSKNIKLDGLGDILKHNLAIWQNAWEDLQLGRFQENKGRDDAALTYTEFPSQYRQVKFFWADRADVLVVDRNIFLWYSKLMANDIDTTADVEYQDILPLVTVRAAFRDQSLRDDFNRGLQMIRDDGEYDRFFVKYHLQDPMKTRN